MSYMLAIDQGTTSSRAIIYSLAGEPLASGQHEFTQHFPNDGWVEHDPEDIWSTTLRAIKDAISSTDIDPRTIATCGITNQRETTVVWDRKTGQAIYPAIVWQDRRTAQQCEALCNAGHEADVQKITGLLLDPYFSATKIAWILDNVDGARQRAEAGELAFGTIDSYLIWRLTNGDVHKTDVTNASRTALFDIHNLCWSEELLTLFNVPSAILPAVCESGHHFGDITADIFGQSIPINGVMGDQQAALFGQTCFTPGDAKSTYGTGCFVMVSTGEQPITSSNRLLTTIAYGYQGSTQYAIEGSIFIAGAVLQWLRDGLEIIDDSAQTEAIATQHGSSRGVTVIPAFTGLGAPYWDAEARGAIFGITRDTSQADIVVACLEAVAFQTRDLLEAMRRDGIAIEQLKIDGGMTANRWFVQALCDTLGITVARSSTPDTTALGVVFMAALHAGLYQDLDEIKALWKSAGQVSPMLDEQTRKTQYEQWHNRVQRLL